MPGDNGGGNSAPDIQLPKDSSEYKDWFWNDFQQYIQQHQTSQANYAAGAKELQSVYHDIDSDTPPEQMQSFVKSVLDTSGIKATVTIPSGGGALGGPGSNVPPPTLPNPVTKDWYWGDFQQYMVDNSPKFTNYKNAMQEFQHDYATYSSSADLAKSVQNVIALANSPAGTPAPNPPAPSPTPSPTPGPSPTPSGDLPTIPSDPKQFANWFWNDFNTYLMNTGIATKPQFKQVEAEMSAYYTQIVKTPPSKIDFEIKLDSLLKEAGVDKHYLTLSPIQQKAGALVDKTTADYNNVAQKIQNAEGYIATLETEAKYYKRVMKEMAGSPAVQKVQKELSDVDTQLSEAKTELVPLQSQLGTLQAQLSTLKQDQEEIYSTNDPTQQQTLLTDIQNVASTIEKGLPSADAATKIASSVSSLKSTLDGFNKQLPPPTVSDGPQQYVDLGAMFSSIGSLPSADALNQYLSDFFMQIRSSGSKEADIAFSSIGQIDDLSAGDFAKAFGITIPPAWKMTDTQFMQDFIKAGNARGVKVNLSFGGERVSDFKICTKPGETEAGQAAKLAKVVNDIGFGGVDWDIEAGNISKGQDPQTFFKTLKSDLSDGKTSTLTIMGSTKPTQAGGDFHSLFYDSSGKPIFGDLFSGLNLMMYNAGTAYYINASDPDWGLKQWAEVLGAKAGDPQSYADALSKIHVGFDDTIPYASASAFTSSTAGVKDPYKIDTADDGAAGAEIFTQVQQQLQQLLDPSGKVKMNLGEPFFWPDYGEKDEHQERYQPIQLPDGTYGVDFHMDTQVSSFYDKLDPV